MNLDVYAMSRAQRIEAISRAMNAAEACVLLEVDETDAKVGEAIALTNQTSIAYSAIAANHIALLAVRDAAAVHGSSS